MGDLMDERCTECPDKATVHVESAEGVPLAWFCDDCWQAQQEFGAAIMDMLEAGVAVMQAEADFAATLPARMQHAAGKLNEQFADVLPEGVHFEWQPVGWQGAAQHTYTAACDGNHAPGPCPVDEEFTAMRSIIRAEIRAGFA
jgi:hypothetical protein